MIQAISEMEVIREAVPVSVVVMAGWSSLKCLSVPVVIQSLGDSANDGPPFTVTFPLNESRDLLTYTWKNDHNF